MRLWRLHPKYLDRAGLVALWRESLLAQQVLADRTTGYRGHPQLVRFREHPTPRRAIAAYLHGVWLEASTRGYRFDRRKFRVFKGVKTMTISRGQLRYESTHLGRKLEVRDPRRFRQLEKETNVMPHPLFQVVAGGVAHWERL